MYYKVWSLLHKKVRKIIEGRKNEITKNEKEENKKKKKEVKKRQEKRREEERRVVVRRKEVKKGKEREREENEFILNDGKSCFVTNNVYNFVNVILFLFNISRE